MGSPPATVPTPAEIAACVDPEQRKRMIRAFTAPLFAEIDREDAARLAANRCRECDRPPSGHGPLPEWCIGCARAIELEALIEEQEDDRHG